MAPSPNPLVPQVPKLRGVPLPVWENKDCDAAYFQVKLSLQTIIMTFSS